MGAVGNYEVVTDSTAPLSGAQSNVKQSGSFPVPTGKVALGANLVADMYPGTGDPLVMWAYPSTDGTSVTWEAYVPPLANGVVLTAHITCAEMGC